MTPITLAGHTLGTPQQTVTEAIELFAAAGLDGAELIWQDDYRSGIPETGNAALLDEIRRTSERTGLPVVGLTPYMTGLNSTDESERTRDVERFASCLADAEKLGARIVRVYAGSYTPDQLDERPALWEHLVASLRELGPVAESHGVVLAVENHFNTMTMTAAETVALIDAVAHPAVEILYDQANLTFTHSEGFEEANDLQQGHIAHVHVKDLVFVDRDRPFSASAVANVTGEQRAVRSKVVGDGELSWPEILGRLLRDGYSGAMSLEYEYRWHPQDLPEPLTGLRTGAERVRAYIDSAMAL